METVILQDYLWGTDHWIVVYIDNMNAFHSKDHLEVYDWLCKHIHDKDLIIDTTRNGVWKNGYIHYHL